MPSCKNLHLNPFFILYFIILLFGFNSPSNGQSNLILQHIPIKSNSFVLSGHTDLITDVQFSANFHQVATCGRDGKVIIWDTQSGKRLNLVDFKHFDPEMRASTLCFAADDNRIVVGSPARTMEIKEPGRIAITTRHEGGAIWVWDWRQSKLLEKYDRLDQTPRQLAISQDNKRISLVDYSFIFIGSHFPSFTDTSSDNRLMLNGQVGLYPTARVVFDAKADRAIAMRTVTATTNTGNKRYKTALGCWNNTEKSSHILQDQAYDFVAATLSHDGDTIWVSSLNQSILKYNYKGYLIKEFKQVSAKKIDYLTSDDLDRRIIAVDTDGKILIKDSDTLDTLHVVDSQESGRIVRSVVLRDNKLHVVRGGFQYSQQQIVDQGINYVLPEKITLETYTLTK